jgi:acyl carrier protein
MVPSGWVRLPALPLTTNGKLDRAALLALEVVRADDGANPRTPLTAAEQMIASIWSDALGVPRIGAHDNFFELGGSSLIAMRVHQKLQNAFARELTVLDVFHYPTVGALARHLTEQPAASVVVDARARGDRRREALRRSRRPSAP